jgi:hypothetical protein
MKGSIYCILDNTNGKYYIGSTTKNIEERLYNHETNYNVWVNNNNYDYITSYIIIQNNNYKIYLIKEIEYDEDEEDELLWLERKFIEDGWNEGGCINKLLPITSREERFNYTTQYRIDNKYRLLEKIECLCGKIYTYKHKSRHEQSNKHQKYLKLA